jgi:hypothetical protein
MLTTSVTSTGAVYILSITRYVACVGLVELTLFTRVREQMAVSCDCSWEQEHQRCREMTDGQNDNRKQTDDNARNDGS